MPAPRLHGQGEAPPPEVPEAPASQTGGVGPRPAAGGRRAGTRAVSGRSTHPADREPEAAIPGSAREQRRGGAARGLRVPLGKGARPPGAPAPASPWRLPEPRVAEEGFPIHVLVVHLQCSE